ncbi:hypothetical protein P3T16_005642 [Paraburkholderia sp. GAS42]|jgi:hypothetical protein
MSVAGWFIVLLALVGTNMPFLNQRLFTEVNPVRRTRSYAGRVLRRAPELDFRESFRQSWKLVEGRKDPGVSMAQHRDAFFQSFIRHPGFDMRGPRSCDAFQKRTPR